SPCSRCCSPFPAPLAGWRSGKRCCSTRSRRSRARARSTPATASASMWRSSGARRRISSMKLLSRVGGAVDQAVLSALSVRFQSRRKQGPHDPRRDRRALLLEATRFYDQCEPFFVEPAAPRIFQERRGRLDGGEIVDLKWQSGFLPLWP